MNSEMINSTAESPSTPEGNERFRKLLESAGGTFSASQAAVLLNISENNVRKYHEQKTLLGIKLENETRYPVWQFTTGGNVLEHLPEILNLLNTDSDIAKVRFFHTPLSSLSGTVVDALRKNRDLNIVKREAANFGIQGG